MENIIINDDCFNIFSKLEKQSIDLICVDLPYGQLNCEWDTEIDLIAMWAHLKRILKQNGQCVFFCNTKFGYKLIESNPKWYRYDMVWEKNTWGGFLRAKKCPLRNFEMIYIFHNSLKPKELNWTYNPQMVKGEPDIRKAGKPREMPENYMYSGNLKSVSSIGNPAGLYYPKSILKFSGNKTNKRQHPTEKPVEILEWLIKTYSNENDMVLDFTAGSCSTAVACKNLNRKFICIEKEEKYFNIGMQKINNNI